MSDPTSRAEDWLRGTYGGMVELSGPGPVAERPESWVFGCRARPVPGYPATPMSTSLLAVPENGSRPFHPATDDPWGDLEAFDRAPAPREAAARGRRAGAAHRRTRLSAGRERRVERRQGHVAAMAAVP